ncbi:MAG: hypothetical protein KDD61_16695, partial [Bdellovibrionales bacterium]|nr:hypothetical protein [Bdellovibrionales bacterium]
MSHSLYLTIANEVSSKIGVQLGTQQLNLIQTRIQKRIRSLYLNSIVEYNEYYQKNKDLEFEELISVLTTHHTFFFREFIHFEFLKKNLPRYVNEIKKQGRKTLKVWSAASSYGQEIYSLAIFLKIHLRKIAPSFDFQILGTDIDSKSIAFAKKGIYKWDEVKEIPHIYLTKNFAKGTGSAENFV